MSDEESAGVLEKGKLRKSNLNVAEMMRVADQSLMGSDSHESLGMARKTEPIG